MGVALSRIRPDEGLVLKEIRLAALVDSPFAFGSTYAAEADLTDEEWTYRATLYSAGLDRVTFLARTDGVPTGLVGGYRAEAAIDTVELVSMWASPAVRRSGVGRLLVQAIIDWATEARASSVQLWVTRGNDPAQRFYESLGFRETGEYQPLPSDPCKDEVRMALPLAPAAS